MTLEMILWGIVAFLSATLSILTAGHALLWKRDPRAAMGWIGICLTLPLFGPVLYATFGVNRVRRSALLLVKGGRRIAFRAAPPELPTGRGTEHLAELSHLTDRVTRRRLLAGNRLDPLVNGEEAYPAMLGAIAAAKHSVHLSTYIFDSDRTGREFVAALDAAAARGCEVRVIIDGLGEKYSWPWARHLFSAQSRTSRSREPLPGPPGVQVGTFLPIRSGGYFNLRNHRKNLVVDGNLAFTGGMNIGDRHLVNTPSRQGPVADLHFRVTGPVVADLQTIFLEDWFFVTGKKHDDERCFPTLPEIEHGATVRAIADGPDEPARKLHWMIMGALACASRDVKIMTPYFIPDRALLSALGTASLRGVKVQLLLPGKNNLAFMHWATRGYLWELLPFGIQVRYQPAPFVHSKLFLVDGLWSLVGSANLDPRSLRLNFELNLEVYDTETSGKLGRLFDEAFAASRPVTMGELERRTIRERLRDGGAKLLSPYL